MEGPRPAADSIAPIFLFADDDFRALDGILEYLHDEWCYIRVPAPRLVVQYARQLSVTAVFLAAPVDHPNGGAAALLRQLVDEVGKPVIVLVEVWSPKIQAKWKQQGASDCIPHPTRVTRRMHRLRSKMQDLALEQIRIEKESPASR